MSDTPRTDAAILSWAEFTDEGYGPSKYVHVDDMRALERDLIKAKQAISESRNSDLIRSRTDAIMEANALTEEVARLRGYAVHAVEAWRTFTTEFLKTADVDTDGNFRIGGGPFYRVCKGMDDALKNPIPVASTVIPSFGAAELGEAGGVGPVASIPTGTNDMDARCMALAGAMADQRFPDEAHQRYNSGGWREVPAPRMARTQRLDWGVNCVYTFPATIHGEKGPCYELDLPPLPDSSLRTYTQPK
jgi:hypothetical protein